MDPVVTSAQSRMAGYGHIPHPPCSPVDWAWRAVERQELATRSRWWDRNGDAWHQRNRLFTTEGSLAESWRAWSLAIDAGIIV